MLFENSTNNSELNFKELDEFSAQKQNEVIDRTSDSGHGSDGVPASTLSVDDTQFPSSYSPSTDSNSLF